MKSKLLGIAIKPQRMQPMQLLSSVFLSVEQGVTGDSRGKPGPRQVTLLSQVAWQDACDQLGVMLPWTERRANLLVESLPLFGTKGSRIVLGDAILEITGETDPCSRMKAVHAGLFDALNRDWRGGVTCRVLQGGQLALDMEVELSNK